MVDPEECICKGHCMCFSSKTPPTQTNKVVTEEATKHYADRVPWELEPHYCAHIAAMTEENLHSKHAIAAELAWRDMQLAKQNAIIEAARVVCDAPATFGHPKGDHHIVNAAIRDLRRTLQALETK